MNGRIGEGEIGGGGANDKVKGYRIRCQLHNRASAVSVEPLAELICFKFRESVDFETGDELSRFIDEYYSTVRARPYQIIELQWNRKIGVFEISKQ